MEHIIWDINFPYMNFAKESLISLIWESFKVKCKNQFLFIQTNTFLAPTACFR